LDLAGGEGDADLMDFLRSASVLRIGRGSVCSLTGPSPSKPFSGFWNDIFEKEVVVVEVEVDVKSVEIFGANHDLNILCSVR
jgi:hypothetical protein